MKWQEELCTRVLHASRALLQKQERGITRNEIYYVSLSNLRVTKMLKKKPNSNKICGEVLDVDMFLTTKKRLAYNHFIRLYTFWVVLQDNLFVPSLILSFRLKSGPLVGVETPFRANRCSFFLRKVKSSKKIHELWRQKCSRMTKNESACLPHMWKPLSQ